MTISFDRLEEIASDLNALREQQAALEAQEKALKAEAAMLLEAYEMPSFTDDENRTITLSHRTTAKITKKAIVPAQFQRLEPDKTAIRKYLQGGGEIPGASLETTQTVIFRLPKED